MSSARWSPRKVAERATQGGVAQIAKARSVRGRTNPALKDLHVLVGAWDMALSNARFLSEPTATVHLPVLVKWTDGGDFLVIRQGSKASGAPHATWLIGRDDTGNEHVVLYCDDRHVSRVYRMRFKNGDWSIWRDAPGFHQRFTGKLSKDGNTITATWEMSSDDGTTWEHDFDLTYRRVRRRLSKSKRTSR